MFLECRVTSSAPTELIELTGPDAASFAQAQFCNDVAALTPGASQLNAWLNPQGRVRRMFHLLRTDEDRYLLLLRGGDAASLLPTLRMFVLRLKAKLQVLSGWNWAEVAADAAPPPGAWPIALSDGRRLLLREGATVDGLPFEETLMRDIDAGRPWLPAPALEQLLPSWMEFARLGALSHHKGCYPGQEIVARLHFRGGGDKRVPVRLAAAEHAALHEVSALRDAAGGEAGLLLQQVKMPDGSGLALAVVRRDLATAGSVLHGGESLLTVLPTTWNSGADTAETA